MLRSFLLVLLTIGYAIGKAYACPDVGRLPDYNCDRRLQMVFMGDSYVYGIGDSDLNGHGGYVSRVSSKLPEARITNFGVPGQRTLELLESLQDEFAKPKLSAYGNRIINADTIFLDLGRNDFWINFPPIRTFRNLKRIRNLIQSNSELRRGYGPLVVISELTVPSRVGQFTWVRALNKLILTFNSAEHPINTRFEKLGARYLSEDHLHPTSKGYSRIATLLLGYILGDLVTEQKAIRVDADFDSVYDFFETTKYGTDPALIDTDGDGRTDGEEIFLDKTDPLTP